MNTQIFLLSFVCATLRVCAGDDNVAMESYSSSYKVHPDYQDFEETEPGSQVYGNVNSHREGTGADPVSKQYADQSRVETNDGVWSQSGVHVGAAFAAPLYYHSAPEQRVLPTNEYSVQKHGGQNLVSALQRGRADSRPLEQKSEFSSVIEHISPHDEEQYSMRGDGSVKRVVPKSTVHFTMYHDEKTGNEQNTAYETNVHHESPTRTKHQYSVSLGKTNVNHLANNHLVHNVGEKSLAHWKMPTNYLKSYHKQNVQSVPKHAKGSQNQYKTPQGETSPAAGGRSHIPPQNLKPYSSEQYLQTEHHFNNQAGSSLFPQNIYPNLQGTLATGGADQVPGNRRPTEVVHGFKGAKHVKYSGSTVNKPKGQGEAKLLQSPAGHDLEGSPVQYAVTEKEQSTYRNAPSDSKQNAASSFSNAILTRGLSSWKNGDNSKQTKQYNLWKYLSEIPPIKSIDFQHSFSHLPLVYKPADSFHFEVNPFIDVGENKQESFDHQKALEGSTSFDIKHAIGSGNGYGGGQVISPVFEIQAAHVESDRMRSNQHIKQTGLFSSPLYQVVPTPSGDGGNAIFEADSPTSNSDETTSAAFEGKYFLQQEGLLKNEPLRLHLPNDKELFHHLKQVKLPNTVFSLQSKGKQHPKHYKELGWDKFLHEIHFKQPKKNQPVFNHMNRPIPKPHPVTNGDWSNYKPNLRTGKSSRIIIRADAVPYANEFGNRKSFPVRVRSGNSRVPKEAERAVFARKTLVAPLVRRPRKASLDSATESGRPENEFLVTASYRADRSLKKDPLK